MKRVWLKHLMLPMALMLVVLVEAAFASFPSQSIRIVVPVSPGGGLDLVSRVIAENVSTQLNVQVNVENRPGARGNIAFDLVARAKPDGYTLATVSDSISTLPLFSEKLSFDPAKSFASIALMTTRPVALAVHPSVPATDFRGFARLAQQRSDLLAIGTGSAAQYLTAALMMQRSGIKLVQVPYNGASRAVTELLGGQIACAMLGSALVSQHAASGKVRILAVTSANRSTTFPTVPTLAESGLDGFNVTQWIGLVAPKETPEELVTLLNEKVNLALKSHSVRERLTKAGFELHVGSPLVLRHHIQEGVRLWQALVRQENLKLK